MWRLLYNVLLILASPVVICVLLLKPRCRRGLPQRLGLEGRLSGLFGLSRLSRLSDQPDRPNRPDRPDRHDRPTIWIHAVSLGEVVAVTPLVKALRQAHPDYRYVVTTVTETGREAVEQRLAGIAEHRYAPLDFPWAVSGMLNRLRPVLYLFVETELWPNLLWMLDTRGMPAVLVNGRLSSRSFGRQNVPVLRSFYRSIVGTLALCLMQSKRDAERIAALGAPSERVHVTGNIKFDQPMPALPVDPAFRRGLGLSDHEPLWLAGSTHPGEEEQLVSAYRGLLARHPSLVLMLAPRHIERADQVELMVKGAGLPAQRRSRLGGVMAGPRVIILDTRGELARAYHEAAIAYVGGTLVPVGGHNLLEPAVWGKPVLFGPHTDHCAEIAALLLQAGGASQVDGADAMIRHVDAWLSDQSARRSVGEAARRVVLENQGALDRTVRLIESCLTASPLCAAGPVRPVPHSAAARS
ncbi:3-deoxy-D-manno-octulosonic acid transferase [Nitrospira moscoviensis]|uniref:3-deoxy-D-manno-octulosonic acid transferase n=1 Tax=Nitrospira moscoviensis TaxID=42253 RepID=A0A0K2GG61_NITMO|nr:3-deoxy-D-manno-octulosonic acid transferase [Nitrospira moscoviensis]ALA59921.1 3-deoxy-D-manno-octulosonic-acid transferase [Nitrospira moscoviensis]